MTVADDLRAARALIEDPCKWGQGCGWRPGTYCAAEAMGKLFPGQLAPKAAYALWGLFRKANSIGAIPDWNDAPERTHAEVLAAFDRAIAAAEARQ